MEECHCGVTRGQALAAARASQPEARKPLTLPAIALRVGAAVALVITGIAVYVVYFTAGPPPVRASPPVTLPPASPVASATPEESPTPWAGDAPIWVPAPPPEAIATRPPPREPTESDLLRARIEQWRGRYRPLAERVAQLQRDLVLLESDIQRADNVAHDQSDPGRSADARRMKELLKERLESTRKELEQARQQLSDLEDSAREDGISPGQLR